ncbi:MAG: T9SS type A sorting domain-containing protein [Bacteroidota bacterium]|nr:T9SS type A sorting domain-containing protein [Bacteroidota bacterium]
MKSKISSIIVMLLLGPLLFGQTEPCGTDAYMEEKMQDPVFAEEWERNQAEFRNVFDNITQFRQSAMNPVVVPVAVHFPEANEADRACLEALAQTQIDVINEDWTATNTEITTLWASASSFYPGVDYGAAEVAFCLATMNHPVGIDDELLEGNPAITIGYNFGNGNNNDANWSGYFNIIVRNIGNNVLGFSPLGGSIALGYGVVIDDGVFGTGGSCPGSNIYGNNYPYHLGRTTTHEVGHFFNLPHTWGNGGCNSDDGIADTPVSPDANFGCPSPGTQQGCGVNELSMNYMDYTYQNCMYMFTQGQIDVSQAYLSVLESQFKPNTTTPICGSTEPYFNMNAITEEAVFSCPSVGEDAVFEFNFSTYNGFNSVVNFSASGQPDGSTVSFSPASTNTDTTVTMTISDITNTIQGSYTITVSGTTTGFGNSDTQTITFDLNNNCTSIQCFTFSSEENLAIDIPDGIDANGTNESYGENILVPITLPDYSSIYSMSVNVDVSHTYIQDMRIALFHPDLTTYSILWNRDCAGEDDLDITFTDGAGTIICASPTVGTFSPFQTTPLSIFSGMPSYVTPENVVENWTTNDWGLYIDDGWLEDAGVLNDWSIEVCVEAPLSNDEIDYFKDEISISPNPSSGVFNVEINSFSSSDIEISVYDLLGRPIYKNGFDQRLNFNETIDLSDAKSGVYLMTVTIGRQKTTRRIVLN